MAAKDKFHDAVREALEKDGWKITHDPLQVKFGRVERQIELGTEQLLAATKGIKKSLSRSKAFLVSRSLQIFTMRWGGF